MKNALLIINKAPGLTSQTIVSKIKKLLNEKKVGHLGTLDSLATGILVVAIGKATRLFEIHLRKRKTYRAIFKFGVETDTFDCDGKIVKTSTKIITKAEILNHIKKLTGKIEQMPPLFSAKKIGGKRASDLTRLGQEVALKTSAVTIFNFELLEDLGEQNFLFEIVCSAGTYIRSLCRDIGHLCDSCATMVTLIRTKCDIFEIENSYTLDEVESGNFELISIKNALSFTEIDLNFEDMKNLLDGKVVNINAQNGTYTLIFNQKVFAIADVYEKFVKIITFFGE